MICVHCHVLPRLTGAGSLCGPCWLTAPNEFNVSTHTAVSTCPCWLSHYDGNGGEIIERWKRLMLL